MADNNLIIFTDQNFEDEVIQSDVPVMVDFWATWCAPCRMIAPAIEALSGEYTGKAKVGKLDVDNNQEVAMRYRVTSIPTVMVFKGGEVVDTLVGARSLPDYSGAIDRALVG
jgi:thioredoxin 1